MCSKSADYQATLRKLNGITPPNSSRGRCGVNFKFVHFKSNFGQVSDLHAKCGVFWSMGGGYKKKMLTKSFTLAGHGMRTVEIEKDFVSEIRTPVILTSRPIRTYGFVSLFFDIVVTSCLLFDRTSYKKTFRYRLTEHMSLSLVSLRPSQRGAMAIFPFFLMQVALLSTWENFLEHILTSPILRHMQKNSVSFQVC